MKTVVSSIVAAGLLAAPALAQAPSSRVYTGVISESMCGINHTAMGISPDPKCIVECVKHGDQVRYVLVDETSKALYALSDQETPRTFAAQRVRVKGVLYPKTKILKVESIEAAPSETRNAERGTRN